MIVTKRNLKNEYPLNNFLNEFFTNDFKSSFNNRPAVNITENEEEIILSLAAPGLVKDDFKIDLDENLITISAEKTSETEEKTENFTKKEFDYSSFKRTFTLPETVNAENTAAVYENGILNIKFPKKEEVKKLKRTIEIG